MVSFHKRDENMITVALKNEEYKIPYGVAEIDGTRIISMQEKPSYSFFINTGAYVLDPTVVDMLKPDQHCDMTDLIDSTLDNQSRVGSFPVHEYWLDIGTPGPVAKSAEGLRQSLCRLTRSTASKISCDPISVRRARSLHEPCFMGNEREYVGECIETGWVSTAGGFVNRFEAELAARCSARHAIATVNGTSALHAALLAMRIGPGDAVVCPTLTFVATANAIAYCGATPLFADSETDTLSLCPARLGEFLETDCAVSGGRLIHKDTGLRIAVDYAGAPVRSPSRYDGPECACRHLRYTGA